MALWDSHPTVMRPIVAALVMVGALTLTACGANNPTDTTRSHSGLTTPSSSAPDSDGPPASFNPPPYTGPTITTTTLAPTRNGAPPTFSPTTTIPPINP